MVLPGPALGGADAAPGEQQAGAAGAAGGLLGADLKHHLAGLDAERPDGRDAEIERAVEIVENGGPGEILRQIREALLEARMHMRADERRHDGLAGQIEPGAAGRQRDLALAADARDRAALDQERRVVDRGGAVARDDPRAFEKEDLGGCRNCREYGQQDGKAQKRPWQHETLPSVIHRYCRARSRKGSSAMGGRRRFAIAGAVPCGTQPVYALLGGLKIASTAID